MKKKVLITGGSGLIGSHLTRLLLSENYEVVHLSRSVNSKLGVKTYKWDIKEGYIDENAFEGVNYIVHLAGAGITDKPWTFKYRKEIVKSRIDGIPLIRSIIEKNNLKIDAFISSSGVNYYGSQSILDNVDESYPPGDDFLAKTCVYWENYADRLSDLTRIVKLRTGIVLDSKKGAYPKLSEPFKYGLGMPLASGTQYMPWIHIHDLCQLYLFAIENEKLKGNYNACAPEGITNQQFSLSLAKSFNKKLWLPKLPKFLLKVIFGDMGDIFIYGNNISSKKIQNEGFKFKYPKLELALQSL